MKLMCAIKGLLLLCAATLFTTACNGNHSGDPVKATLSVSVPSLELSYEAVTKEISVTASNDWGVSVADKSWCSVSPSGGIKGTSTVKVKVEANRTGAVRENTLVFRYGTDTLEVPVRQGLNEEDLPKPGPVGMVVPEGYHLVWNDEFDEGTTLDPAHWTHEVQKSGWVNNELQNYVNHQTSSGNAVTEIKNGSLHIHCFKEDGKIYSGRVYAHVKQGWQYGWFEARINLPSGKGTWPAFWMMPVGNDWNTNPWPMCGEIDIMEEVGCVPNEVSSSIHTQDYNHTKNTQKTHAMTITKAEGEYHVYALEWTEDAITTYVDGKVQLAVKKSALGSGHNQWPFHYAFYPILNLAWGGDWGGMKGVDEGALPVTMSVDYIRVFQKDE